MKGNELKKVIITDIAVLAICAVMLVTLSLAWFVSAFKKDIEQSMFIGKFEVDIGDSLDADAQSSIIDITAAYPMTFGQALRANAEGEKNLFAFEAENVGDLAAMVRFEPVVVSDSNESAVLPVKPLKYQLAYAVRVREENGVFSDFMMPEKNILFSETAENVSLKTFMNTLLLNETTGSADPAEQKFSAKDEYILKAKKTENGSEIRGGLVYAQLLIWVDSAASIESVGLVSGQTPPSLQFKIRMHARQSGGGAYWSYDEIKDNA